MKEKLMPQAPAMATLDALHSRLPKGYDRADARDLYRAIFDSLAAAPASQAAGAVEEGLAAGTNHGGQAWHQPPLRAQQGGSSNERNI